MWPDAVDNWTKSQTLLRAAEALEEMSILNLILMMSVITMRTLSRNIPLKWVNDCCSPPRGLRKADSAYQRSGLMIDSFLLTVKGVLIIAHPGGSIAHYRTDGQLELTFYSQLEWRGLPGGYLNSWCSGQYCPSSRGYKWRHRGLIWFDDAFSFGLSTYQSHYRPIIRSQI